MEQAPKKEATEQAPKNKGGRPVGSKNQTRYYIVKYGYTQNQYREDYDVEQDKVVSVPVDDYEQKVYKERVREELIISDNGVNWMLERNDRLAKLGKKNRIRILDFYPEKAGEDVDAIDGDKDGVKATVMNAGDANHG